MSVYRSAHVVKHFKLDVIRGRIEFGQESFDDTESLIAHFDQCPLIGDETGVHVHVYCENSNVVLVNAYKF